MARNCCSTQMPMRLSGSAPATRWGKSSTMVLRSAKGGLAVEGRGLLTELGCAGVLEREQCDHDENGRDHPGDAIHLQVGQGRPPRACPASYQMARRSAGEARRGGDGAGSAVSWLHARSRPHPRRRRRGPHRRGRAELPRGAGPRGGPGGERRRGPRRRRAAQARPRRPRPRPAGHVGRGGLSPAPVPSPTCRSSC